MLNKNQMLALHCNLILNAGPCQSVFPVLNCLLRSSYSRVFWFVISPHNGLNPPFTLLYHSFPAIVCNAIRLGCGLCIIIIIIIMLIPAMWSRNYCIFAPVHFISLFLYRYRSGLRHKRLPIAIIVNKRKGKLNHFSF